MIQNIRNTYKNTRVQLDNNEFADCIFDGCTMEFSGLGPVSMVGCKFTNVKWELSGAGKYYDKFFTGGLSWNG